MGGYFFLLFVIVVLCALLSIIVNAVKEIVKRNQLRQKGLLIVQEHPEFVIEANQWLQRIPHFVNGSFTSSEAILRKFESNQAVNDVLTRIHGGLTQAEFNAILKDLNFIVRGEDQSFLTHLVELNNQYIEREKERIAEEELEQKYRDLSVNSVSLSDLARELREMIERNSKEEPNK